MIFLFYAKRRFILYILNILRREKNNDLKGVNVISKFWLQILNINF